MVTTAAVQRRRGVYRRRRLLAVAVLLAVVVALLGLLEGPTSAGEAVPAPVTVVVGQGDTVWELAGPYAPAGVHPSVYVARVVAVNGVDARALVPGSVLRLPAG